MQELWLCWRKLHLEQLRTGTLPLISLDRSFLSLSWSWQVSSTNWVPTLTYFFFIWIRILKIAFFHNLAWLQSPLLIYIWNEPALLIIYWLSSLYWIIICWYTWSLSLRYFHSRILWWLFYILFLGLLHIKICNILLILYILVHLML